MKLNTFINFVQDFTKLFKNAILKSNNRSLNENVKILFFGVEDLIFEHINEYDFGGIINNKDLNTEFTYAFKHAYAYMPMWNRNIRKLVNLALNKEPKIENFFDIGSGKGKPCIYVGLKYNFKNITGVEFSRVIVEIAEKNKLKSNIKNINFICCDAANYILPNGNNFILLFNPFDAVIMNKFLLNNLNHFKNYNSIIGYINDLHRDCFIGLEFKLLFRDANSKISLYSWPKLSSCNEL